MKATIKLLMATVFMAAMVMAASCSKGNNDGDGNGGNGNGGGNNGNEQLAAAFDENGASYALFSVSPTKKVRFSRGNLQYQASTNTWRFAENQLEYMVGGNENPSETSDQWIDIFSWGTSGWNSGANLYQPWSTSNNSLNFRPGGSNTSNLTDEYAQADWGVHNPIQNGGNQAGMWRTLTEEEVRYLRFNRNDAVKKCSHAMVNNHFVFIILPDDWTAPSGINFRPMDETNTYTLDEWKKMEAAGAILFPPSERRRSSNNQFNPIDTSGGITQGFIGFWTSTRDDERHAWAFCTGMGGFSLCDGIPVRLVKDA